MLYQLLIYARIVVLPLLLPLIAGCGNMILNANFEANKYQSGSSFEGLIPGSPSGDSIHTTGETIGIHENIASLPNVTAVTGNKSMLLGFTSGIGHEVENGIAYFSSAVIDSTDSKFTIFWAGKKFANDSTIVCNVGGIDASTNGIAAFRVTAGSSDWTVVDATGSHTITPVVPRQTGQDAPVHNIDIDYWPGSGTFTVDVKQLGVGVQSYSGTVFPTTQAQIQSTQRIGIWCLKTSDDASFLNVAYLIDGVVMREK